MPETGILGMRLKKMNDGIIHFKRMKRLPSKQELEKRSKAIKMANSSSKTLLHCSAILQPVKFAQRFKDVCYCATCCEFYVGFKKNHTCWVPLTKDFPKIFKHQKKHSC